MGTGLGMPSYSYATGQMAALAALFAGEVVQLQTPGTWLIINNRGQWQQLPQVCVWNAWTINELNKMGRPSHWPHRMYFGKYQASSGAMGGLEDGDCYLMHKMQSGDLSFQHKRFKFVEHRVSLCSCPLQKIVAMKWKIVSMKWKLFIRVRAIIIVTWCTWFQAGKILLLSFMERFNTVWPVSHVST